MRCNDKNYIKRLKNQKEDALDFIVDKYASLVKSIVYHILKPLNKEDMVDDCINDIFLSVWTNASKFAGKDCDFKSWIYKVARYKAIDYYRKSTAHIETTLEDYNGFCGEDIEAAVIKKESDRELLKLINTLDDIDRDIFLMKYYLGMQSSEISRKLNISISAVDNRVYRGKKKLKLNSKMFDLEVI